MTRDPHTATRRLSRLMKLNLPLILAASLPSMALAQDSDADGAADAVDLFPCDSSLAGEAFAPAEGVVGVMVFEDQWPSQGDLDFNDVTISYYYRVGLDAQGRAVTLHASFDPLALGGLFDNGLGLRLPVAASNVSTVERRVAGGPLEPLSSLPGEANLTVELSTNLRELFSGAAGQINSLPTLDRQGGALLELEVRFATPVTLAFGNAPFDLFTFRSDNPGIEIHRPEFLGTVRMNTALFNTQDDASSASRAFVDFNGLPFALVLPDVTPYPAEATPISQLFPNIVLFAASGGIQAQDFYLNPVTSAAYVDRTGLGSASGRIGYAAGPVDVSCLSPMLDAGSGTLSVAAISGSSPGACTDVPISNVGSASATGINASFSGADAANFELCAASTNPCGASIAAGASCNLGVRLVSSSNGTFTATLGVTSAEGASASRDLSGSASVVVGNFPNIVGFYGSNAAGNSWAAIVSLSTPIAWTDQIDFNNQADAYCQGEGFVGAVKTRNGVFSTDPTYYLQSSDGVIAGNGPGNKITRVRPGGPTSYTNVYTNRRNTTGFNGRVGRATIGNDDSTIVQAVSSPTTGAAQAVLCQTQQPVTSEPNYVPDTQPIPANLLGFYGSNSAGNSWAAIVALTSPIAWTDQIDFNDQADVYCQGEGFVGVVKTRNGAFSTDPTYYLQSSDGIIAGNGPGNKITRVRPGGPTSYTNVYTNRRNTTGFNGRVGRATIGNDDSSIVQAVSSPTTGTTPAVLCQTQQPVSSEPVFATDFAPLAPEILGFYGSNAPGNSWAAIVDLTSPIAWTDQIDFNNQADAYCQGLGFPGVVKTRNGAFSTDPTYYLQSSDGIIAGNGPGNKITRVRPGGPTSYTNVYTNRRNTTGFNGMVGRATIGNDDSTIVQAVSSPTTGTTPAVLCQTTQSISVEPVYVIQ